ncbi:MAG TPA: hypothetical protein VGM80_13610 [Gaiellaceae bacterium]|jgi:hypothetical protein
MRFVIAAAASAVALLSGAPAALPMTAAGPQFGVYTANVGIAGAGHLAASIHVLNPTTQVTLTFDCGKPAGRDTVTEGFDSPPVPLHGGAFTFAGTASLTRFTTLTGTNALLKRSSYKATVHVNGAFTSRGQFVGTVQIGGSPCVHTSYTAIRVAGPTP